MTKKNQNILIIDDDQFIREILVDQLTDKGYTTSEAVDGFEGLKQFQILTPDIVLLDLRMPKLNGFDVLESLVKNSPNTPVIIVSGEGTMEDVIKALRLGAWDYLIKPIQDFNLLTYTLDKVSERARLIDENTEYKKQLETKVEKRTQQLKSALDDLDSTNQTLKKQNLQGIRILSAIIEMRPGIYKGHSKFVAEKSALIARELGLEDSEIQTILFAGLLLQIGKMSLPEKMLSKPFYTLQTFQRNEFMRHAIEGEKLVSGMEHLQEVAHLIRSQYEMYDGTGGPDGLSGEEIPIGARILTIIQDYFNYFHGITTGKKMIFMNVIKRLKRQKNKRYDPKILDLFIKISSGGPYQTQNIIIETEWFSLQPGMQIVIVKYRDIIYLKNKIATNELIEHIKEVRDEVGAGLIIKVQIR